VLKKKFRLKERQVKKVLLKWKPFFSYWIVLNFLENNLKHNRFAIVISWKSVKNNVWRVFFRRRFYDFSFPYIYKEKQNKFYDLVFVVKKQTKLDKKDKKSLEDFFSNLKFLFKKFLK